MLPTPVTASFSDPARDPERVKEASVPRRHLRTQSLCPAGSLAHLHSQVDTHVSYTVWTVLPMLRLELYSTVTLRKIHIHGISSPGHGVAPHGCSVQWLSRV